ncbi:MAG: sulfate/thiosulfate transport system substrate-binding protein [Actinomycetota bacterium]|nr:sulfate/thiosulfate transport system substrate-binding protein [Actinomycetota bacterium]
MYMGNRWSRGRAAVALSLTAMLGLSACASTTAGGSTGGGGNTVTLSLVAYSTPQTAYEQLITAFQQTPAGKNVRFTQSYGASGDQSRAVDSGLNADYVAFSLETDMTRLVDDGKVAKNWDQNQYHGMVTDSVVSLVTRKGNPKHITDWSDLTRKDVDVITPNPFSSGSARWNIMAAYGAQIKSGKSPAQATAYLKAMLSNVSVQDDSGRAALQTFTGGKGDVLISYENEAIFAQKKGEQIDYVIPDDTLLIENPAAVTTNAKAPEPAKAWLQYLYTPEAQQTFADNGYRPVVEGTVPKDQFPTPRGLFTIKDLGGWDSVTKTFFDTATGVIAGIEKDKGVSVEKK